ncbi:uncharacterized protein LOC144453717 [Glandiceps talaboti]
MKTNVLQWIVQYCIVVCVIHLSLTVAQQQNEDTQTDVSQRCGNGVPGIPGVPGTNGLQGPRGDNGLPGAKGDNGTPGPEGPKGGQGILGVTGPKGDIGLPGFDGIPGDKGERGDLGSRGQPGQKGATGKPGPQGNDGEVGQKGLGGLRGQNGTKGERGIKGDKGSMGLQGHKGHKGEAGQVQQQPRVAFSATLTSTMVAKGYSGHQVIVYDKVYSNDGNGYSTSTGKFTCPVSGMYVFMISAMRPRLSEMDSNYNSYNLKVCLMKNTTHLPCTYINNEGRRQYGTASNSVIIDVQQGDEIWIKLYEGYAVYSNDYEYTTFAGYLLYSNTQ